MSTQRGITFVEILIAAAVILAMAGTAIGTFIAFMDEYRNTTDTIAAAYLLEEGVEAVKTLRDRSWSGHVAPLSTGTGTSSRHYLSFSTSTAEWSTAGSPEWIDGMKRWFTLEEVDRDSDDDIVDSGTVDPGTRKLTVGVAWSDEGGTTTKEVTTYITDLRDN